MALKITRATGEMVYLGSRLEPDRLEETFTYRLWIRKIFRRDSKQVVIVNLMDSDGVEETEFEDGKDSELSEDDVLKLGRNITVRLVEIAAHKAETKPFCKACGRGDYAKNRSVPQAKLAIEAPHSITILRDDARKKK